MKDFRIATWNIRKCVGLDRRRDPARVLSAIAHLGADIVALQEADRRLGARPATLDPDQIEGETGLRVVPIDDSGVSLGWHGNALLTAPHITVEATEQIDLPGLEPRGAILADLHGRHGQITVVATHLGLTRRFRRRQLQAINRALAARPARPTIILGDFNEWSKDRGLEALARFNVHAPGRSFHAARPIAALDRIAACPAFELRDAGVSETKVTRVASDHLPVWADLTAA